MIPKTSLTARSDLQFCFFFSDSQFVSEGLVSAQHLTLRSCVCMRASTYPRFLESSNLPVLLSITNIIPFFLACVEYSDLR